MAQRNTPTETNDIRAEYAGYETFARDLAIAYVAHQGGISHAYAAKRYGQGPPGLYWLSLAKFVAKDVAGHRDAVPPVADVKRHGPG